MRSIVLLAALLFVGSVFGESAIPLLSGFDSERLAKCYPIRDTDAAEETAKLVYRLRSVAASSIKSLAEPLPEDIASAEIGDVFLLEGELKKIRQYEVPESLREYLDLDVFQELVLDGNSFGEVSLIVPPLEGKVSLGDRVAATAMLLYRDEGNVAFATGRAAWFPSLAENEGIRLLVSAGVDASGIAIAAARNRRKLEAADGDAFYSILAASAEITARESLPEPKHLQPIALLQDSARHHGEWIRMQASTVRITKVNVTDAERREQLGQDHYFQIDSSGDLGKTIVKLTRADGEPIRMSGTYPVSLVSLTLPEFLRAEFEAERSVVQMVSTPVRVDGFFYRLWSYRNEFIDQRGGGSQVGPLMVVSRWRSLEEQPGKNGGIAMLGYAMAGGVIFAIVATFFWSRRNAAGDAQARAKKQENIDVTL